MRFIESNEIEEWCRVHGIALAEDGRVIDDPNLVYCKWAAYAEGQRSGREAAVVAACLRALGEWDECLLWIRTWGIWPSSEDWPSYYALRGAAGERRSLNKAPGHLFAGDENCLLGTFPTHVLQNAWDADVLPVGRATQQARRAYVSHDEWVEIRSASPFEFLPDGV